MSMATDREALAARLRTIAVEMDGIVRELGPKWIRLAHLRKESQMIIRELRDEPSTGG